MITNLEALHNKKAFICDMDGVIYHGNRLLEGVPEFHRWLVDNGKDFLFLTNSSERAPRELAQKLGRMGLDISEDHFYTSALATAAFLASQCPGGSVYVIGEPGLVNALYDAGLSMNDYNPDYVVFGETRSLSYEKIERAVELVFKGAKLIGTNSDITAPGERGIIPACRALISPIELATNRSAYYHAEAAIIGDRMDTDIIAGIESELDTVLVLSGVTSIETMNKFPYRPNYILNGVGDIPKAEIEIDEK